jgi:nucleotide-binding universal stress UspA family protein
MFQKILCADDLSKRALSVLKTALSISEKYGAELIILNVQKNFMDKEERMMLRVDLSDFKDEMTKAAIAVREHIEREVLTLGYEQVKHSISIHEGKPVEVIRRVSDELAVDLIVVGLFGSSILKDKLFGSVAEKICTQSHRSVLTVWNRD